MNRFFSSNNGGLPVVLNDVRWILGQSMTNDTIDNTGAGIYQALNNLLRALGNNFIVYGCDVTGDAISEGWIMLNGELLKVDAHNKINVYYQKIEANPPNNLGKKTFQNAIDVYTYKTHRGVCSAAAGNLAYNGDTILDVVKEKIELQRDVITVTNSNYTIQDNDYIIEMIYNLHVNLTFPNPASSAVREIILLCQPASSGLYIYFKDYLGVTKKYHYNIPYVAYHAICDGINWFIYEQDVYTKF